MEKMNKTLLAALSTAWTSIGFSIGTRYPDDFFTLYGLIIAVISLFICIIVYFLSRKKEH
jgi:Flp pilus assembly pilin Flp